nr:hypothetical protein [Halorhodospira abdelmalekii]
MVTQVDLKREEHRPLFGVLHPGVIGIDFKPPTTLMRHRKDAGEGQFSGHRGGLELPRDIDPALLGYNQLKDIAAQSLRAPIAVKPRRRVIPEENHAIKTHRNQSHPGQANCDAPDEGLFELTNTSRRG